MQSLVPSSFSPPPSREKLVKKNFCFTHRASHKLSIMFSAQTSEFKTHSLGMKLDRHEACSHLEYFQHRAGENPSYPIPTCTLPLSILMGLNQNSHPLCPKMLGKVKIRFVICVISINEHPILRPLFTERSEWLRLLELKQKG